MHYGSQQNGRSGSPNIEPLPLTSWNAEALRLRVGPVDRLSTPLTGSVWLRYKGELLTVEMLTFPTVSEL